MYWSNFLHFYQPPTQKPYWIHKITAEAYRPILRGLKAEPRAKATLNVSGVLLELLEQCGEDDVIGLLRDLLGEGRIELTGSAKYHPLLPFLPEDEVVRQVKLHEHTLKKYLGDLWRPRGFFPPEMGFDRRVAETVARLGYRWVIADELSFPQGETMDHATIYTIQGLGDFEIYFRERRMSWVILSGQVGTGRLLVDSLGERLAKQEYLLTAMDGETFGHHRPGLDRLLFEMHRYRKLKPALISDLPRLFRARKSVEPLSSTWALMEKDLERKAPFARWKDEDNAIHAMQWELTELALKAVREADAAAPNYAEVRSTLDRALHSDQYWWASARPWWSIEMVERGAKELWNAVLEAPGAPDSMKRHAAELYQHILSTAFDWQREGIVDEKARREDEDIRQRTDRGLPRLPRKEIEKMIAVLKRELRAVVRNQEFERAAQIRDRIAELGRYAAEVEAPEFAGEGRREFQ